MNYKFYMYNKILHQYVKQCWDMLRRKLGIEVCVPWMKYREISIIKYVLHYLSERVLTLMCAEYGSGYSTIYFPKYLDKQRNPNWIWRSVEHDRTWAKKIHRLSTSLFVSIRNVSPDTPYDGGEGTYDQFKSYITHFNEEYDFVLIDGRARYECVKYIIPHLTTKRGTLVVHDMNRNEYIDIISMCLDANLYCFFVSDYHTTSGGVLVATYDKTLQQQLSQYFTDEWFAVGNNKLCKLFHV